MRCTVCGRDRPVTYRSAQLGERAMCATCIRAGRYGRLGRAAAHSLIHSVRRSLGLTSQVERMRIAGEAAAEGIRQGHERARAERERHTFRVDPGSFDAHTVTIFDNDNWTVGHPYTCKHGWLVTGCPVTEAVRQHLDTGRLEENEHWATGEYWCWLDRNSDNILVVPMEPETLREPAEPMKPQPEPPRPVHQFIPSYMWINVDHTDYAVYNDDAATRTVTVKQGTLWLESGPAMWGVRPREGEE